MLSQSTANKNFAKKTNTNANIIGFQQPSICIPHVFANININRISKIFSELDLGKIGRIDMHAYTTRDGKKCNRVIVHFESWNENEIAKNARSKLTNGDELKIIYDDPWFWKVRAYKELQPRRHIMSKPVIKFEDHNVNIIEDENAKISAKEIGVVRSRADQGYTNPISDYVLNEFVISQEDASNMSWEEIWKKHEEHYNNNDNNKL